MVESGHLTSNFAGIEPMHCQHIFDLLHRNMARGIVVAPMARCNRPEKALLGALKISALLGSVTWSGPVEPESGYRSW
jgi:hypothetical protein